MWVHNKRKYYYTGIFGTIIEILHALPVYLYKFLVLFFIAQFSCLILH